ncbi:MAG: bifunctional riboflavin kinase/FAD synthetase [bacterium]|nr:bifunctional riboflavin kinase/FAD synthetase [bacterium]
MKIYYGLQNIKKLKAPVVALGTFDGVHLGHQQLIRAAVAEARRSGGTSVVLTFDHIPREILKKNSFGVLLTTTLEKVNLIRELGIQVIVVLKFNQRLARMTPQDFVRDILVKKLGVQNLWVGENYRFGAGQEGTIETLKHFGKRWGYGVKVIPTVHRDGQKVSSSKIRELLRAGKIRTAAILLGHPYILSGRIIQGRKLGRQLNFPTANLDIDKRTVLPLGVYAAKAMIGKRSWPSAAFIGYRTGTGKNPGEPVVEAHLLGFKGQVYGKVMCLNLVRKIRDARVFRKQEQLAKQIAKDVDVTARYLNKSL